MKAIGFKVFGTLHDIVLLQTYTVGSSKSAISNSQNINGGYQWKQQNGTSKVILVTLLLDLKKYTFLLFYVWISEFRMGGYFLKTGFLNR